MDIILNQPVAPTLVLAANILNIPPIIWIGDMYWLWLVVSWPSGDDIESEFFTYYHQVVNRVG